MSQLFKIPLKEDTSATEFSGKLLQLIVLQMGQISTMFIKS